MTVVVVSYSSPQAAAEAVRSALAQTLPPEEVIVVDNDPAAAASRSGAFPPEARILHPGANLGYTGAVNLAASESRSEWLFLLNPDAIAAEDCLQRLVQCTADDVAIVGAQVLLPDGRVNAGDNPINIAGISWSGRYGQPAEQGPPRDTAAVSGAAVMVRREAFASLGGLCPYFFMYVDDTDLAWRARLAGWRVRFCPAATVVHDYQFDKGAQKWFYLERNREWALLSNLGPVALVALAPVLVATEAAVLVRALREGWLARKLAAWGCVLVKLPSLLRWRRRVQATRTISDRRVLELFRGAVETDLLEEGPPPWANAALDAYRRCVLRALGG